MLNNFFSTSYSQARQHLVRLLDETGHQHEAFANPSSGPDGDQLTTDVIFVGEESARKLVVVISGTHGVEFYCGSACQLGWLTQFDASDIPGDIALLFIHCINPYGAAWRRRVNEDNVDLNRNFVDHDKPCYQNPWYGELHDYLIPESLTGPAYEEAKTRLADFRRTKGEQAFFTGLLGQYSHADGFYYGGQRAVWSNLTLRKIINRYCKKRAEIAVIDLHTGLGPFGYGLPGVLADTGSEDAKRAAQWYGRSVTTFTEVAQRMDFPDYSELCAGFLINAFRQDLPGKELMLIAVEFGTFAYDIVLEAEIADAYLYNNPQLAAGEAERIRSELLHVYYPNTQDWQEMIWWRFLQILQQTVTGLSGERGA